MDYYSGERQVLILQVDLPDELKAAIEEAVAAEVARVLEIIPSLEPTVDKAADSPPVIPIPLAKPSCGNYYLDEAGDTTLFAHKGKVIIGQEGCSRYAMLGLLDVRDPDALARDVDVLRAELLADPYFRRVPSFEP